MAMGHSKSMFARNLNFGPPPPLFIPVHFTCIPYPSTYVYSICDAYEFSNEKSVIENRKKIIFCRFKR